MFQVEVFSVLVQVSVHNVDRLWRIFADKV